MKKLILLFIWLVFMFFSISFSDNLVNEVFEDSSVIKVWSDQKQVWNKIFSQSNWLVSKITKLMLQFAIAIWLSMFLYWWINFMLSNDEWKMKTNRNKLFVAWIWIALALWSYVIITLMTSITTTINN